LRKAYSKVDFGQAKISDAIFFSGQSLLLSTTVLNDGVYITDGIELKVIIEDTSDTGNGVHKKGSKFLANKNQDTEISSNVSQNKGTHKV